MIASRRIPIWVLLVVATASAASAQEGTAERRAAGAKPIGIDPVRGDRLLADYFRNETRTLSDACLSSMKTAADWEARRADYKTQLLDMLGLNPLPERTPLQPVITGTVTHDEFVVEKLHYQASPGLYVTANLYRPKVVTTPLPAILYVCGHANIRKDGVSYGNKVGYQHHGAWFARNGYVCLIIDTIQLGEFMGYHHGTYKEGWFWWNSRGYTPAGVEAWNSMRGIDYLVSRPEVDAKRIGVTGRSGGGGYSWYTAAIDDRVTAAVPVAGITDLENHVVDGVVEGHCDCMYMLNRFRWDYAQVAALVAPRPLLISNTDKDRIFPLEGVVRLHEKTRRIYRLVDADKQLGLQITEGPHLDTQELHIHAFRWFNRFFKNDLSPIDKPAVKFFPMEALRVFDELPKDQRVTTIHDSFVPKAAPPSVPTSSEQHVAEVRKLRENLLDYSFRGWPGEAEAAALKTKPVTPVFDATREGIRLLAVDFESQHDVPLRLYVAHRAGLKPSELKPVVLNVLGETGWLKFLGEYSVLFGKELAEENPPEPLTKEFESTRKMFAAFPWGMAYLAPRGVGRTAWDQSARKQVQNRRRFVLLGQTLDGMRVWDIRRGVQTLRGLDGFAGAPLWLQGEDHAAVNTLYAALFEGEFGRIDLWRLPESHMQGPDYLNVLRVTDIPEILAAVAGRSPVIVYQSKEGPSWTHTQNVAKSLGWDAKQLRIREVPATPSTK